MTLETGESAAVRAEPGAILANRYRVDEEIGRGGMAAVYRAEDVLLGRTVALKVFRRDLADAEDVGRQRDEMQVIARLNHPSLVTLYDAVADESGAAFLVLEHVPGRTLRQRLSEGALGAGEAAAIGAEVAQALAYTHSCGVIHRDVKPANILLRDPDGETGAPHAKLADFGIARLIDGARMTVTGNVIGTASYLSPEQAAGEAVGPPSDVYSFGLVLIECLTGVRAFEGSGIEAAAARLVRDPHVPDDLDREWFELLTAMTARQPEVRPSAREVADRLAALVAMPSAGDATRRYPVIDPAPESATAPLQRSEERSEGTAPTAVVPAAGAASAPPTAPPSPAAPEPVATATPDRRRRPLVLLTAVIAAAVIAGAVWLLASRGDQSQDAHVVPPLEYPAVEGELGEHLRQLQESIERSGT